MKNMLSRGLLASLRGARQSSQQAGERNLGTLCIVEAGSGELDSASKATLACAQKHLPKPVVALVASDAKGTSEAAAGEIASLAGVETVLHGVSDKEGANGLLAEPLSQVVAALVGKLEPTHIVTGSNTFGKNLLPRVAALLDSAPITDVVQVVDESTFVRPIYAGNALSTVKFVGKGPLLMSVRTTAFGSETLEKVSTRDASPRLASPRLASLGVAWHGRPLLPTPMGRASPLNRLSDRRTRSHGRLLPSLSPASMPLLLLSSPVDATD